MEARSQWVEQAGWEGVVTKSKGDSFKCFGFEGKEGRCPMTMGSRKSCHYFVLF